jgi:hypothetical protein
MALVSFIAFVLQPSKITKNGKSRIGRVFMDLLKQNLNV